MKLKPIIFPDNFEEMVNESWMQYFSEQTKFPNNKNRQLYFAHPLYHNEKACEALKEYRQKMQEIDAFMFEQITLENGMVINGRRLNTKSLKPVSIFEVAEKYGVTVEEMKQHYKCINNEQ